MVLSSFSCHLTLTNIHNIQQRRNKLSSRANLTLATCHNLCYICFKITLCISQFIIQSNLQIFIQQLLTTIIFDVSIYIKLRCILINLQRINRCRRKQSIDDIITSVVFANHHVLVIKELVCISRAISWRLQH